MADAPLTSNERSVALEALYEEVRQSHGSQKMHRIIDGCTICSAVDRVTAAPVDGTSRDAEDAARYRFLREPGNAIVYAKHHDAWGVGGSGHVRYREPAELDTAIDSARAAVKTT